MKMLVQAARRWLLVVSGLTGLVAVAFFLRDSPRARSKPATRPSRAAAEAAQEARSAASAAHQSPAPTAAIEWRLEVEIHDPNDVPVAGRVYVTSDAGELLSVLDNEAAVPSIHQVRGIVNVIVQGPGFGLAPRLLEGIAAPTTGIKRLRVRLEAGLEIAGRLVDDAGDPLGFDAIRLQVRAEPVDAPWLMPQMSPSWRNVTDAEGHWIAMAASRKRDSTFEITGLPPGLYRLQADTTYAESLLAPDEPPLVRAGARDVVLVLRRAVEVRICFVDNDAGAALDEVVGWRMTTQNGELISAGRGSYEDGLVLYRPPGSTFVFEAHAESHEPPQPLCVSVNRDGTPQQLKVGFRREAGGTGALELLVWDDAGDPAFPLSVGRALSSRTYAPRDGRYVLQVPAGIRRIELRSPSDQILLFKREWIPSVHDPDDFSPAHAYLPLDLDIEVPRGGRVTKAVTIQRAALIWVRVEPTGAFSAVRLLRRDTAEMKGAMQNLYEGKGLVAAVEPGTYTVEGRTGEGLVSVTVAAKAAEVAEVWLRSQDAK